MQLRCAIIMHATQVGQEGNKQYVRLVSMAVSTRVLGLSTNTYCTQVCYISTSFMNLKVSCYWDFLPKYLSIYFYTTLEGFLDVQRSGKAQKTISCLFGPLFFTQNGRTFKNLQKVSKSSEKLMFFRIFSEFVWKTAAQTKLHTPQRQNNSGDIMVFTFLFDISDLWRRLVFFFSYFQNKAQFPLNWFQC